MLLSRCARQAAASAARNVEHFASFQPSPLTISQLVDFGRGGSPSGSFAFLQKELLVRLANMMREIALLPPALLAMPSVRQVQAWYGQSFADLHLFKDSHPDPATMQAFLKALANVRTRHTPVVETMAEGLLELRDSAGAPLAIESNLQYFLDRLYLNRISMRMLISQHLLLFGDGLPTNPRLVGAVDPNCDVVEVLREAYSDAQFLCESNYLISPELELEVVNSVDACDGVSLAYVPGHLHHILFELLKNAMRAVVETTSPDQDLPPIQALVVKGKEDVSVQISDRGGGVPRSVTELLFHYLYSTAPRPARLPDSTPMAGYGFGLSLSRLYARYFQGELSLASVGGYGTRALVQLKAEPSEASEQLPVFSTTSVRNLTHCREAYDWSVPH